MHPWWINVLISIKNLTDPKLVNPYVSITVEWNRFHTGLWSVNPAELIDKHVSHLLPSGCCCERSWTLLSCPSHTLKHTHTHIRLNTWTNTNTSDFTLTYCAHRRSWEAVTTRDTTGQKLGLNSHSLKTIVYKRIQSKLFNKALQAKQF